MARQIVNHNFASRLARSSCALVPVITPQGNVKHLRVTPSVEPTTWLLCEWVVDKGRKIALRSVELTTERVQAGAVFLRDAYMAEGWPEGWQAYEAYLRACYERTQQTANGPIVVRSIRSREDLHFPDELLPHAVAERIAGNEDRERQVMWEPPKNLVHPAVAKRQEIDEQKALLRAQIEREAQASVPPPPIEHKAQEPKRAK